jgi:hypothetical protein
VIEYITNHFYDASAAILLACFTAYLGWRSWNKFRLINAKDAFNKKAHSIFEGLYPIPTNWPNNGLEVKVILEALFNDLQVAVNDFRQYLPKRKQTVFDEAWFIYRLGEDGREIDKQCYQQYMGFSSPDTPTRDSKELFHENVSRLLSFAK